MAVIVNDMAEVGIDAEAVRGGQTTIQESQDRVVELSNGCICCTLRDDLLQVCHPDAIVHLKHSNPVARACSCTESSVLSNSSRAQ